MSRRRRVKPNKPNRPARKPRADVPRDKAAWERARAASSANRYADAAALWRPIEEAHPGEPEPPLRLAHAWWNLGRVYDARQAIRRGLRRTPATPDGWCRTAKWLGLVDGYPQAIDLLNRAVEADPACVEAWHLLAVAAERVNRLDDAVHAAERALELDAADAQARLTLARLRRRRGAATEAVETLDTLLGEASLDEGLRISAHYEHAAALDACARYDEAWDACGRAKALLLPHAAPFRPAARRAIHTHLHLAEHITQDDYTRWAEQPLDPLPFKLAFLVGHPRSGTTLVEKHLARSTGALDIDEQPFLDAALGRLFADTAAGQDPVARLRNATRPELQQVRRAYAATLADFAEQDLSGRFVLDKHPEMIRYLPYLVRVFPEAELIVVRREMRDVVLSCYMLPVPLGPVSVDYLQVEAAAQRYRDIMAGYQIIDRRLADKPIAVTYEQFVKHPAAQLQAITDPIGWPISNATPAVGEKAGVTRSPSYADVQAPTNTDRIERWRHYTAVKAIRP